MKTVLILLISLSSSITATCQKDTLTRSQLDSLARWIGFINTDLHDYDLLKVKAQAQEQQIKGLQEINRNQKAIETRKDNKLDNFATTIMNLQANNFRLADDLKTAKNKAFWRSVENWCWRVGAIAIGGKLLKLY